MELSDYKQKQKELDDTLKTAKDNYDIAKKNLAIEYARANTRHSTGDIVCEGDTCIKVEKIIIYLDYDKPECIYKGTTLKKDLKPTKIKKEYKIHQSNVTRSINS